METEILKTFDENHKQTGVATRAEIHANGLWHETFHCWLISQVNGEYYLYFQLRSADKKDYPSLFDITAAGHLLATESPEDGIRELREELGLSLLKEDLEKIAVIPCIIEKPLMIDREFSHVFLAIQKGAFTDFHLQVEEVAGIVCSKLMDVVQFIEGDLPLLPLTGFKILENGEKVNFTLDAKPSDFVRYNNKYMTLLTTILKKRFL
ncbi:NUDIX domain-containing protein [Rummeliibacillus sp. TYF005]|uniref:NUDIX hydrolase n=1 Tax=Rummeliibacillus sp. TYF005 TaxID=2058214 RepID=UPI000FAA1DF3|nr:NUDIX domain-containing protein [Rummeliibacillus sp. TYF005]RPJ95098.1 NUDIX hydrolase [Rummeliibacillus sp. TYF005]